tara:strand:+ start:1139 stop:2899 length:1761 start_codon:yes stop_codon:yes gene_type:complete
MALFDKTKDISSFNWNSKIGRTDETNQDNLPQNTTANKMLEDRLDEVDDQYKKFNGNKGLRTGNLGFDEPFIIKEVGDRYESADFNDGIFRGGLALNVVRAAEDVTRLAKWTLTPRGVIWNIKQFLLQAQNAREENRTFNPLGPLGSVVPAVHLPRHMDGFNPNPNDAPIYEGDDRLESIWDKRIVQGKSSGDGQSLFQSILNVGSTAFTDPADDVRGSADLQNLSKEYNKQPNKYEDDGDIQDELYVKRIIKGEQQEPNESNREWYDKENYVLDGEKLKKNAQTYRNQFLSDDVKYGRNKSSLQSEEQSNFDVTEESLTDISGSVRPTLHVEEASKYDLGTGQIINPNGTGLYSVGVSNQLNSYPYKGKFSDLETNDLPKDFIKFRIRDAVNGKWIIFPAFLSSVTDTTTPDWTTERYIGRPDSVHLYAGAARTVGFEFKVAAFTKQEIPIIQQKMNALVGLGWPTFKKILSTDDEERMVAPYVYLTIGDMYNNTPGYFSNITITSEETGNWELDDGFQIPMHFTVALDFVHVGKYLPHTLGKHFDFPQLKDSGVGNGNYGVFGQSNPRESATKIETNKKWDVQS